jgi:transcriptional regulator with XRE-family HTH domain
MTDQPESLAVVVGRNCRRIRSHIGGVTQDELARYARRIGLRWTASSVGDFEAGRSAPTFATVLAVTLALQMALEDAAERRLEIPGWRVMLADLVSGEARVALTDSFSVDGFLVEALCRGHDFTTFDPPPWRPQTGEAVLPGPPSTLGRSGLTEHRLARRLKISEARLAHVSFQLWQSTFTEERDRRAGPDANQQKRGRISRELRAELEKALSDGND